MSSHPSQPGGVPWLRLLPFAAGTAGIGLLFAFVSPGALAKAVGSFDVRLLPLLAAIVVADYAVRFWRWRWLVKLTTGRTPPAGADLAVFLAANTLILTPMRAGDLSRSAYTQALFGIPAAETAPVPLLERIVDLVLMTLFAVGGTVAFGATPLLAVAGCMLALTAVVLLRARSLQSLVVTGVRRVAGGRIANPLSGLFLHLDGIWRLKPLAVAFALGAVAWLLECAAFFVVLWGLRVAPSVALAGQASFIYPVANLAGSLSMLPGGLGVAEGSVVGLTRSLIGTDATTALAAGLLIRGAIVGFGVISGLPGLFVVSSRIAQRRKERATLMELQALIVRPSVVEA